MMATAPNAHMHVKKLTMEEGICSKCLSLDRVPELGEEAWVFLLPVPSLTCSVTFSKNSLVCKKKSLSGTKCLQEGMTWQGIREQKSSVMTWDFSLGVGYYGKGMVGRKSQPKCDHYFIAGKNTMHQLQVKVDAATQEVRRVCCLRGIFLSAIAQTLSTISRRQFPFLTLWPTPLVALEKSLLSGPQCSQIRLKGKVGWSSRFP